MRDGFRLTCTNTRGWFFTIARSTRSTTVPDLFALFMFYKGHRFFTEDVNLIRPYLEDFWRTDFSTLPATIALIRINGNVPVPGPILKSIISYDVISFFTLSIFGLNPQSAIRNPQPVIRLFFRSLPFPSSTKLVQTKLLQCHRRAECQRDICDRYTLSCSKLDQPF